MELEIGDVVLCTVEKIAGTIVFVKIEENGQGSIVISEIAPGRIRNLREYVVPKKKIVCKVLRITPNKDIHLSLRRVTQKEKKEVLEQHKQEKSYKKVLKSMLGERAEEIIKKIESKEKLFDFLEEAKEKPKDFEKLVGKEKAKTILEILKKQKQKKAILKKEIKLTTKKPNGIEIIKEILTNIKEVETKYVSAGRYSIKIQTDDIKTADNKLKKTLQDLEKKAKKQGFEFFVKEK